jgi:3',5'-cyclic AMP phosphodiesterase CpdA
MNIIRNKFSQVHDIKTVAILADAACRAGWEDSFLPLLSHVWRKHKPDLFLVAGDLAVHGTAEEFQRVIAALAPYPAWLAAVPGDHDKPLKEFVKHFGSTRKVVDVGKWRFLGINTAHRAFSEREADFLEGNLHRNTLILSHVPPGLDGWTFHSLGPPSSARFLSIIDRHRSKVRAAFFGHIHGYSRRVYADIPFIVTGAVAESWTVRNNCYEGPGFYQMMLFDTRSGALSLCRMDRSQRPMFQTSQLR